MKKLIIAMLFMAPLSVFAQKFAHYDLSQVMPNMAEYKTAQTELDALSKQYEDDLKRMQEEYQKKAEDLQKATDLPDNVKQRRESELQELQVRFQQVYQENQESLQKASQEKMQAIQDKITAALKKIGEAQGYVYIVDTSAGAIAFVNSSLSKDITPDVKKELGVQ